MYKSNLSDLNEPLIDNVSNFEYQEILYFINKGNKIINKHYKLDVRSIIELNLLIEEIFKLFTNLIKSNECYNINSNLVNKSYKIKTLNNCFHKESLQEEKELLGLNIKNNKSINIINNEYNKLYSMQFLIVKINSLINKLKEEINIQIKKTIKMEHVNKKLLDSDNEEEDKCIMYYNNKLNKKLKEFKILNVNIKKLEELTNGYIDVNNKFNCFRNEDYKKIKLINANDNSFNDLAVSLSFDLNNLKEDNYNMSKYEHLNSSYRLMNLIIGLLIIIFIFGSLIILTIFVYKTYISVN